MTVSYSCFWTFDTVDYEVLISRLEQWVGITGSALQWFRSYLSDRSFCISIDGFSSTAAAEGYHKPPFLDLSFSPYTCCHLALIFRSMIFSFNVIPKNGSSSKVKFSRECSGKILLFQLSKIRPTLAKCRKITTCFYSLSFRLLLAYSWCKRLSHDGCARFYLSELLHP